VKRKWLVIGLIVVLGVGGFVYWRRQRREAAAKQAASGYSTAVAKRSSLDVSVTGTASIVANDKRTVKSTVSGTVSKILVDDGGPIKEGQVMMSIKNDDLVHQYEQTRVDLESARLRLEQLRSPSATDRATAQARLQQTLNTLENRKKDLEKLAIISPINGRVTAVKVNPGDPASSGALLVSVADDTEIQVMAQVPQSDISKIKIGQKASVHFGSELPPTEGTVDAISAEAGTSGRNTFVPVAVRVANPNGIYRSGLVANVVMIMSSQEDYISAGATVAPKVKYDMRAEVAGTVDKVLVRDGDSVKAGQTLVNLVSDNVRVAVELAESEVQVARETLDRIKAGIAPTASENEVKQQELRVRQAELLLQQRAVDVNALQVKSPINGIVVSHTPNVSDTIANNANLFVVADYSKMTMVIPVDELDISGVQIGQKATVVADALPNRTFNAEVTKMATEGTVKDGVANYDVTLTLLDTKDLRGSMTGNATIVIAHRDSALVVPAEAIRTQGGRKTVVMLKNGSPQNINVRVGLSNDTVTEIISGIEEGDEVVITSLTRTQQGGGMFGPMRK